MKPDNKIEGVVLLLFGGMVFFTGILIFCEIRFPMDGQMFQVIAGLLTGFSGAFFMRVKPKNADPETPPVPTHTLTTVDQDARTVVQETSIGPGPTPDKG